jgi:hypothetical protein
MYSISTLKIDDDKLQITVGYDSMIIGQKILELSFNEDMSPTFAESGYTYLPQEFDTFVNLLGEGLNSLVSLSYSFDDQDRFDGFELTHTVKSQNYLVIKTHVEKSQTSIWVLLNDETIPGIVSDLKYLSKQINELIESQKKYLDSLANPYPESDD